MNEEPSVFPLVLLNITLKTKMQKSKFGIRGRRDERKRSGPMSLRNTGSEKYHESGTYNTDPPGKVEQFFSISATSRQDHIRNGDLICLKNYQSRKSEKGGREMPFYENEIGNKGRRISEKEMFGISRYRGKTPRYRMSDGKETEKTWRSRTHGDEDGGQKRRKRLVERSNYPFNNVESYQRDSKERSRESKFQEQYMEKNERAWGKLLTDQIRKSEKRVREMPFFENEIGNKRRRISEKEMFRTSGYRERIPRNRMRDGKETKETWRSRTHGDEGGKLNGRKHFVERSNDPFYDGDSDQRGSKERSAERKVQEKYMEKREKAWGTSLTLNNQREAYDYSRNRQQSPEERRFQIDKSGTESKKQQMLNEDRWIIEPLKNKRKENDDVAAKVFTVLVDNGGKLKRKELESKLRAKPLTIEFVPSGALVQFLKDYRNIFEIQNSSSEEQEEGEILDPIVSARSDIQICVKHASSTKSCTEHCNDLHVCKFYFISECSFENCKFGHDLDTEHNKMSLEFHHMQHLNNKQVKGLLTDFSHRRGVTIPSICSFYNYIQGCSKPKSECPHLHVCKFITDKCAFYPSCKRSHQLDDDQPKQVLRKHGIEVTPENKDIVIDLLRRGLNSKLQVQVKGESKNDAVHNNGGTDEDMQATDSRVYALQPQSELGKNLLRYWNIARLQSVESTKNNA